MSPKKGTISIGNTSFNHHFSGDMLVFRGVNFFRDFSHIFVGKNTSCKLGQDDMPSQMDNSEFFFNEESYGKSEKVFHDIMSTWV